jgi:hypothetical protein
LVITYGKLPFKYENLRKRSKEGKIIFTFISDYSYRYRFHFFDYRYPFLFRSKNQKKLENDYRKSEIIIFVFIPNGHSLTRTLTLFARARLLRSGSAARYVLHAPDLAHEEIRVTKRLELHLSNQAISKFHPSQLNKFTGVWNAAIKNIGTGENTKIGKECGGKTEEWKNTRFFFIGMGVWNAGMR